MYTILLIDDKKIVQLNRDILHWYKYDVMEAYTLAQAEELLNEKLPDLIVLGVELPDGSGLDYCRKLKARYNSLPVVLISGESGSEHEIAGLRSGADDYITKPYSMDVFEAKIAAKLGIYSKNSAEA